ncbi:MAG TPA: hypothetical protein VMV95_03985 [Bacillota bacterium]|nr:hypothetical protein [Bacillota bacterium]
MDREVYQKIIAKREFTQLPKRDVEKAYGFFERRQTSDEEKIRLTRELLHKVFGAFGSRKLLSVKDKEAEWVLKKHLSTRERLPFYRDIYKRILKGMGKQIRIIDLGAGVNGFSYGYFQELGFTIDYLGIEAIAQFVDLMNYYFKKNKVNGKAVHLSLFECEKIKRHIGQTKGEKIIFLFKTLDSLEMLENNYSKKLLEELTPLVDRVIISFATESMIKRKKFRVKRKWILDFIKERFRILDDFELGPERFIIFCKG